MMKNTKTVYWSKYENYYYPGDYALKDEDGYLWLLGRADDILKVAGHRIGTAELESCHCISQSCCRVCSMWNS